MMFRCLLADQISLPALRTFFLPRVRCSLDVEAAAKCTPCLFCLAELWALLATLSGCVAEAVTKTVTTCSSVTK